MSSIECWKSYLSVIRHYDNALRRVMTSYDEFTTGSFQILKYRISSNIEVGSQIQAGSLIEAGGLTANTKLMS